MYLRILFNVLLVPVISMSVALLFSAIFRRRYRWLGSIWFFVLMFLGTWALGSWLEPMGPPIWSVQWVPFVIAAALLAVVFTAATLALARRQSTVTTGATAGASTRAIPENVNLLCWLLFGLAVVAIMINYLRKL